MALLVEGEEAATADYVADALRKRAEVVGAALENDSGVES